MHAWCVSVTAKEGDILSFQLLLHKFLYLLCSCHALVFISIFCFKILWSEIPFSDYPFARDRYGEYGCV